MGTQKDGGHHHLPLFSSMELQGPTLGLPCLSSCPQVPAPWPQEVLVPKTEQGEEQEVCPNPFWAPVPGTASTSLGMSGVPGG